jgi:hydroxypyruvate reductase
VALLTGLRAAARGILDAAIEAADAHALTRAAIAREGGRLAVGGRVLDLGRLRRVLVVGMGKASAAMAAAVEEALADFPLDGLVVVKEARGRLPRRLTVVEAGHPVPDERGQQAADRILSLVGSAREDDLVLCLVSGGGSALTPAPVESVTLAEKQVVTKLLLAAGATINELNAVRKHLSRLKGGQLARAAAPAPVVALLLSDVIGDPLDVIASGPTAPDPTTFEDALGILYRFAILDRVPASVRAHLEAGAGGRIAETPKAHDAALRAVTNRVIGNNGLVVEAAAAEARRRGLAPLVLTRRLQGEAREAARVFGAILHEVAAFGQPGAPATCVIAAGETTVTVRGSGKGGRCQEFSLAAALEVAGLQNVVVLAAGTDGSDGPTEAAGAVADGGTVERARARGLEPGSFMDRNDSHALFSALGDLVTTGPTGTNLLDLYLGLVAPVSGTGQAARNVG